MQQALYQATTLTFEELGFMFPIPDPDLSIIDPSVSSSIRVGFHGEFDGEIVLKVENRMLPAIAENMLGEETPLDEEIQRDALCEIANVICGNALPIIAGKKAVFKLSAPEFSNGQAGERAPDASAAFSLDEGRGEVAIFLNGAAG